MPRKRACLWGLIIAAACRADIPEGVFRCADGRCPPGYTCRAERCVSSQEADASSGVDAATDAGEDEPSDPVDAGGLQDAASGDASGPAADGGECPSGNCDGDCTPDETRCEDGLRVQRCSDAGQWDAAEPCPFACLGDRCGGECRPGNSECPSPTARRSCGESATWSAAESCANGCSEGRCRECIPGESECSNATQSRSCSAEGSWGAPVTCPAGCSGDACVPQICAPRDTECTSPTQFRTCSDDGASWSAPAACPNACVGDRCAGVCAPNASECVSATEVRTCNALGQWSDPSDCPNACVQGACGGECRPGAVECAGTTAQTRTCSQTGSWGEPLACATATCRRATCSAGTCGQAIDVGASCGTNQICDAAGMCVSACGNGEIAGGEECEVSAFGWNEDNCNAETCTRSTYTECDTSSRQCAVGCTVGGVCGANCETADDCPPAPGQAELSCYQDFYCALGCAFDSDCPRGLTCVMDPTSSGSRPGVCLSPAAECECDNLDGCADCLTVLIID